MEFKKFATVDMRKRGISEASIESLIAAQPELLGLGDDLVLVDRQRQQRHSAEDAGSALAGCRPIATLGS